MEENKPTELPDPTHLEDGKRPRTFSSTGLRAFASAPVYLMVTAGLSVPIAVFLVEWWSGWQVPQLGGPIPPQFAWPMLALIAVGIVAFCDWASRDFPIPSKLKARFKRRH